MNRNTWILAGVAAAAFLAFVLVQGGEEGASTDGGSGILGLFRGGGDRAGENLGAGGTQPGGIAPAEDRRRSAAGAAAKKRLLKKRPKPGAPPDPALLERMQAGAGALEATGQADSPRGGIVRQSFRGTSRGASGGGTQVAGGAAAATEGDPEEDAGSDPEDCGAPRIEKTVVDLQARPEMRAAFDVPSRSFLIGKGWGERFSIGGAPAFVILIPRTKRASAGAIFDERFLVLISGHCVPDRAYVKALLRQ